PWRSRSATPTTGRAPEKSHAKAQRREEERRTHTKTQRCLLRPRPCASIHRPECPCRTLSGHQNPRERHERQAGQKATLLVSLCEIIFSLPSSRLCAFAPLRLCVKPFSAPSPEPNLFPFHSHRAR